MWTLLYFLPLINIVTIAVYVGDPTIDEIAQAYEVKPLKSWGHQARTQNSMRILNIGGSNTAICTFCKDIPSGY